MENQNVENVEQMDVVLDWDSALPAEPEQAEFTLPDAGDYDFTVESLEKTFSKSNKKMAKIVITINNGWHVYDNLVLISSMSWKIAQFFESVGLKKKGEPLSTMPWDAVVGLTGRCKIKHEIYNGKENCKVDRYYPSDNPKTLYTPAPTVNIAEVVDKVVEPEALPTSTESGTDVPFTI